MTKGTRECSIRQSADRKPRRMCEGRRGRYIGTLQQAVRLRQSVLKRAIEGRLVGGVDPEIP